MAGLYDFAMGYVTDQSKTFAPSCFDAKTYIKTWNSTHKPGFCFSTGPQSGVLKLDVSLRTQPRSTRRGRLTWCNERRSGSRSKLQ